VFGSVVTENLKENGHSIPVTNENRNGKNKDVSLRKLKNDKVIS
jgi:hypothetical protein